MNAPNDGMGALTPMDFQGRRAALASALRDLGGGLAILSAAPPAHRNGGVDHPYRFDSDLFYLTGVTSPDAHLLVCSDGSAHLFAELGLGSADAAPPTRHAPQSLDTIVSELLAGAAAIWFDPTSHPALAGRVQGWVGELQRQWHRALRVPETRTTLRSLVGELRLRKDDAELALMRRSAAIAATAHRRVMQHCRPGMREYELDAELLHHFRREGASGPAYPNIVSVGAGALDLHRPAGDKILASGALCLVDAGCEFGGYASDVTRTFPVDGQFRPAQRALYELVLAARRAALDAVRPAVRQDAPHVAAVRVLTDGMIRLGLLQGPEACDVDTAIASGAFRQHFDHVTSHWIGIDVHDTGAYLDAGLAHGSGRRPTRMLEPGMAMSIEPGLYVRPSASVPEAFWNIGIRVEDVVVVQPGGCEVLSEAAPVDAGEIERLMASGG